jgi:SprT protein
MDQGNQGMDTSAGIKDVLAELWTPEAPLPAQRVLRKLCGLILEAWDADGLQSRIRIVYNARLCTTLGRASLEGMRVELNPHLLREHPGELIPTLAHELAHLVVQSRYGKLSPHGQEFQTLLRALNLSAQATHRLPVDHIRRKRERYLYLHRCSDCGYDFVARSVRRQYYCTACGPEMRWDIFRVPNSAAGRALLLRLRRQSKC